MKAFNTLVLLLAGISVSAHSELLRGSNHERPQVRRLKGGPPQGGGTCINKDDCNDGKCKGGTCKCDDGYAGFNCDFEWCGKDADECVHGDCKKNKCECDDDWTGDECDKKKKFEVRVIAVGVDPGNVRSVGDCEDEVDDAVDEIHDMSDKDLHDMPPVTFINMDVSSFGTSALQCGDDGTSEILERMATGGTRHRHLKPSHSSRSRGNDEEEFVLVGMVVTTRSTNTIECARDIEDVAKKIEKKWKAKDLHELDGHTVQVPEGKCNDHDLEGILKHEV